MLLLLGQMSEQAGRAREDRNGLHGGGRKAQVEHHRRDRHGDVHRERLAPGLGHRIAEATREQDVGPAHPAGIRELENPLGARVERPVNRMAEARHLAAGSMDRTRDVLGDRRGLATGRHLLLRLSSSRAHDSDVPRMTGPQPRIPAATAPAAIRGRRQASCARRRWWASSRARRSRRAAGRGRSAGRRSARGR